MDELWKKYIHLDLVWGGETCSGGIGTPLEMFIVLCFPFQLRSSFLVLAWSEKTDLWKCVSFGEGLMKQTLAQEPAQVFFLPAGFVGFQDPAKVTSQVPFYRTSIGLVL